MFNDPIFDHGKAEVWPLFWPVFFLSILRFRQQSAALSSDGCVHVGYRISPFGLIHITDTVYAGAPRGWKDQLFAAAGGYGTDAPELGPAFEAAMAAMANRPDPRMDPSTRRDCVPATQNWVFLGRGLGGARQSALIAAVLAQSAEAGLCLPRPDT